MDLGNRVNVGLTDRQRRDPRLPVGTMDHDMRTASRQRSCAHCVDFRDRMQTACHVMRDSAKRHRLGRWMEAWPGTQGPGKRKPAHDSSALYKLYVSDEPYGIVWAPSTPLGFQTIVSHGRTRPLDVRHVLSQWQDPTSRSLHTRWDKLAAGLNSKVRRRRGRARICLVFCV